MTRLPIVLLAGLVCLAGCPDNPYKASTWTKKLDDPREAERAVTELEQLGDPSAIPDLGKAWTAQGKPVRLLQVIISLARPLTKAEAAAKFVTDYEETGRKASWDAALPFLTIALSDVDEANPRSVDSATKAADALAEARLEGGLDPLIEIANKPVTKKLIGAQIGAIRAIGKYDTQKQKAAAALQKIIDREPPAHPRTATKENKASIEEKYSLFLGVTGAAINALGELHYPAASKTLVLSLYRTPELFTQIRRALAASGNDAKNELTKVLRGENQEVNELFKNKRLDKYCGDRGDATECVPVSAKDFYPAVVLGDFYDPKTVPDLLAALKRPPLPVYYMDDQPSPNTQYNAIFDALRKIGAADAAAPVRAIWAGHAAPAPAAKKGKGKGKGAPAEAEAPSAGEPDLNTRILAISAYPFLVRDDTGTDELGRIAADNKADDQLRQEAATAFARLSSDAKDIKVLEDLAQKYFDAAAKKRAEADGKPKADKEAADKVFEVQKKEVEKAKADLVRLTNDKSKTAADIKAATAATKKVEDDFKEKKKKHKEAVAPFNALDGAVKAYKQYARMFQTHIARIEIGIRCKKDLNCYKAALQLVSKPDEVANNNAKYIKDIKDWTKDEKMGLVEANIERAMLEIGKAGPKAAAMTDDLLEAAKSDNRLIRQSVLLALPKIAAVPCKKCEQKLIAAYKAGEGKTTLGDLQLETQMLTNYFAWAGGNTPSTNDEKAATAAGDTPAAPAEKPPADEK